MNLGLQVGNECFRGGEFLGEFLDPLLQQLSFQLELAVVFLGFLQTIYLGLKTIVQVFHLNFEVLNAFVEAPVVVLNILPFLLVLLRQELLLHLLLLDGCALFLNTLLLSLYFQIESLNCNTKVLFFQP